MFVLGCAANHDTKVESPSEGNRRVYVDGNNDGFDNKNESSYYARCLREHGYNDKEQNPFALEKCQKLFGGL